jgi:hypothetical protein
VTEKRAVHAQTGEKTKTSNFGGPPSEKERKRSMNKFVPTIVLGFALGSAALASADPGARPFHADDSGAVVVTGLSSPFGFSETGWTGHATHLGAFTWEATGSITVTGITGSLLDIKVHGNFTLTAANGDTIYGFFDTTGTLDPVAGAVNTSGPYVFLGGTGRFTLVAGGGTIAATGTTSDASCPMNGWIEY